MYMSLSDLILPYQQLNTKNEQKNKNNVAYRTNTKMRGKYFTSLITRLNGSNVSVKNTAITIFP